MHKHASWIVALVVGVVIGAAADRMVGGFKSAQIRRAPPVPAAALQRQARPVEDPKAVYRVPVDDSPVKGSPEALVTIVESSDFQCPFCKRVLPTLQQLERDYGDKIRFVFKENPLSFHDKALQAAMAAEEARAQGGNARFWAMHDKLFAIAPALDRPALEQAAKELGLDLETFRRALDSNKHEGRIRRDQALVSALGANGTPSFFINGRKLTGAQPIEAFKAVVDEELRKAELLVKSGVAPRDLYAKVIEGGATSVVYLPGAPAPQAAAPAAPPAEAAKVPVRLDDPVKGPGAAKVTLVLFSDFQCPFCSRVVPTLAQLEQSYGKDLRVVWKHEPLPMHPNAFPAALAAEAAREQGKFWPMHDLLFRNQGELSPAKYEELARQLGLDLDRFRQSVATQSGKARIEEDQKLAAQIGASGTPTLFVNCRKVVGAQPYEVFKGIVGEEIAKADRALGGKQPDVGFYDRMCDENVKAAPARAAAAPAPAPGAPVKVEVRADDPVKGPAQAPVTIVEFSDFQCPFCSRAEPTVRQLEQLYGKDLRVVWKHQPLPFHPNAMPAAEAAEAAREQGKFWQMHDLLFENQATLSPAKYEELASRLGLDLPRFRAALSSSKYRERIQQDMAAGRAAGATGTPTFVVNGEVVVGAQPIEAFKAVIDRQLERARQARR